MTCGSNGVTCGSNGVSFHISMCIDMSSIYMSQQQMMIWAQHIHSKSADIFHLLYEEKVGYDKTLYVSTVTKVLCVTIYFNQTT